MALLDKNIDYYVFIIIFNCYIFYIFIIIFQRKYSKQQETQTMFKFNQKDSVHFQFDQAKQFDGQQSASNGQISQNKNTKLLKKSSIKTAASNFQRSSTKHLSHKHYRVNDLHLSSIQFLERETLCKISQNNGVYPSSFQLISINKKQQEVSLKDLLTSNFSVLSYSIKDLISFSVQILKENKYASQVFETNQIEELVTDLACNYNSVSYHNFSHAFSLMQLNYQCLDMLPQFRSYFTQQEIFYTLIAGLAHDLNHNGTNNIFEVKCKTDLALQYKNESVLENMHLATLWRILDKNPKIDFRTKSEKPNILKQTITKLILSTDMNFHFKKLDVIQKNRKENPDCELDKMNRWLMMQEIFHACDLGNATLQFDSYISWAALLSHQFNEQYKTETLYEIETTKSFEYKNFSTLYNDQVWFVGKIVYPLWKQLSLNLPKLTVFKKRIEDNIEKLNQKLTEEELKKRS